MRCLWWTLWGDFNASRPLEAYDVGNNKKSCVLNRFIALEYEHWNPPLIQYPRIEQGWKVILAKVRQITGKWEGRTQTSNSRIFQLVIYHRVALSPNVLGSSSTIECSSFRLTSASKNNCVKRFLCMSKNITIMIKYDRLIMLKRPYWRYAYIRSKKVFNLIHILLNTSQF